jgi:pimeloyl-ACP methyl ester carboxylesterase
VADHLSVQLDHLAVLPSHPVFQSVEAAAERLCLATPGLSPDLARTTAERLTEPCEGGVRWRWDAMLRTRAGLTFDGATMTAEAYHDILARITAPTCLVYGDGSRAGSEAARDAGAIAPTRARRIVLPGGHNLHFETPEALAALIAECSLTS